MIRINEVAFTGYPVTDMPRARGFYEDVLQLKPANVWENEGRHWIEYELGPATLAISNMWPTWRPSSDGPCIAFEVADFDVAMAELRRRGVKFALEPIDSGSCQLAIVADPDGNAVAIHRRKQS
ncbi:MAG TPA: VOC family protein [Opitutaceae bacterium]|nr:VOC family protein [Opitutaceae bacterium]